ncbi:MAG: S41 family peptidase [Chloroflexi bacterium]|nr:MAG: S41 family peptidase [Chloroflexota bacterium]
MQMCRYRLLITHLPHFPHEIPYNGSKNFANFGVKWMTSEQMPLAKLRGYSTGLLIMVVFMAGFALGSQFDVGFAQGIITAPPEVEEDFAPFWEVFNLIEENYFEPVETSTLVDGAITGMVDSLGDQFSGYMTPDVYPLLNDDLSGEIEGIGVVIRTIEETEAIEVVNVLEGAPAEQVGIMPGDIFVEVDGESVAGFNQLDLASRVRGAAGTNVAITMLRGDELIEFNITRARIEIPNIESDVLDNNIGYIKLNQFSEEARTQIDEAIAELDVNNRNGLIIDFRGNPGGFLTSAIDVASAFIPEGTILVEDFGDGTEQIYNATGDFQDIQVPIVVLVDESSASASELVAGALQDTGRATIIGETTLGKGTVQTWRNLVNGGGVRLTIARWLTPNRRWIHGDGVTPDVIVEWTPETGSDEFDPQIDAAIEFLTSTMMETAGQ